jgi:hypothetical protein
MLPGRYIASAGQIISIAGNPPDPALPAAPVAGSGPAISGKMR